jgi:hypothetical protein
MDDRPRIDLYCEDSGHEQFSRALIHRLARDLKLPRPDIRTASGLGGHGRALKEFRLWQRAAVAGEGIGHEAPDLLVLLIDSNCSGWSQSRRHLEEAIDQRLFPRYAIGCPDPHVERWCLADPGAVQQVLGTSPPPDPGKCERNFYKTLLRKTIREAGQPILTTEMEYAPDLVDAMDLFRAGKNQASLRHFVDELRSGLQTALKVTPNPPPDTC